MSYILPQKLQNMTPYEPDTAQYPIRLDANESFLTPTPAMREAIAAAAADASLRTYPDPDAAQLCERFAAYYGIDKALVTAGNGSDELLSVIAGAFLQKGDTLAVSAPDFSMYAFYADIAEAKVLAVPKREDLTIDVQALIAAVNQSGARVLMFSNPCNPASTGLPRETVRSIIRQTEALVVLDEAYMDFWDQSLIKEAADYDNLIVLRTCSKMMGMAGLRIGFAVANPTLTAVLHTVKSPYNVNTLSQAIGAVVLKERDTLQVGAAAIIRSRDALYEELCCLAEKKAFRVFPTCTNFVTLQTPRAKAVFEAMKTRGILIRCFGDYLRITAGTEAQNRAVLTALAELL